MAGFDNAEEFSMSQMCQQKQAVSGDNSQKGGPDVDGDIPQKLPRVLQDPRTATIDDVYTDFEAVPFLEERIKTLLSPACAETVERFHGALQVPFPTILLAVVSLASFTCHRTLNTDMGYPALAMSCHFRSYRRW